MEACASAHHWARELAALGHEVKLMPPQYVKPYVKRGKNDAADAEAICEAVTRPRMRFVGAKSPDQQATMMLHRVRKILTRQRTQISNALRAHMAEFGITAATRIGKGWRCPALATMLICRAAATPKRRSNLRSPPMLLLYRQARSSAAFRSNMRRQQRGRLQNVGCWRENR
jgi:hypothetical protein